MAAEKEEENEEDAGDEEEKHGKDLDQGERDFVTYQ